MSSRKKIDATDAVILKTLLKESRTSFTEIAKDCKISVSAVRMRYKRLWKAGIVKGEMMLVNPHSLGYKYITDLGITTAVENEREVERFLASKKYIAHMVGPFGKYNFWAKVALHDTQTLARILEDIESNPQIKNVDAIIWVEAINIEYPENLVIKPLITKNKENIVHSYNTNNTEETQIQIDETDRKIAIILSQHSRTPFRKIAEALDISTKNVIQRYKRLRKKVLTRSTVIVDPNKLGYQAMASVFVKAANRSKMPEIHAQMLQIPNLIVTIRLIGAYDLYAAIFLTGFKEFFNVKEQIRRIKSIEETDTILTPAPPVWPLNLFPSLLQSEFMQPKFAFNDFDTNVKKS